VAIVNILTLAKFSKIGIERYESIGRTKVKRVVDPPIYLEIV
jgi:hypothetical protein